MFGYIRVLDGELKIKEYNHYRNSYCRLCRNIGSFSQAARMFLSYDMTFFSLLLDECNHANDADTNCRQPKCHKISGHCKKECTDETYQFTAAASIVLTYEKILDDIRDGNKFALFLRLLLSHAYKRAAKAFPETSDTVHKAMERYYALENAKLNAFSLAKGFGDVMSDLVSTAGFVEDNAIMQLYANVFHHIGSAIYLIDAIYDIAKDRKSGNYNPILQFDEDRTTVQDKVLEYLGEAEQFIELLPYRDSIPILRNIIHYGIPYQLDKAINKE